MTPSANATSAPRNLLFKSPNEALQGHSNRDVLNTLKEPPSLKLLSQGQLESLEIPNRDCLLGEWLTVRHPCMVYAQTGRGKSLFSMSIAIAVAGGGEVFGWKANTASKVLYIDAEMDVADIKDRNKLLLSAVAGLDKDLLAKNLTILSRHYQSADNPFPDLADDDGCERRCKSRPL